MVDPDDPRLARIEVLTAGFINKGDQAENVDRLGRVLAGLEAIASRLAALEADNVAKSKLMADLSHKMRTPLSGVVGMADLLLETPPLSDEQREYAEAIRNSAEELVTVIDLCQEQLVESAKTAR